MYISNYIEISMCYHTSTAKEVELREFLGQGYTIEDYHHYYHVTGFSHPLLPVATNEQPQIIQPVEWGLIPFWAKDEQAAKDISLKTLNARSETIFTLPSFRDSIVKRRCLIFVNGFFEWEHQGKETLPYFIYMPDHKPFALGGIWSQWTNKETAELHTTCSIITTAANELMSKIHNTKKRMPLILNRDKWDTWLSKEASKETVEKEMQTLPDGQLQAHRISKLITSRAEDSNIPEVQLEYKDSLL